MQRLRFTANALTIDRVTAGGVTLQHGMSGEGFDIMLPAPVPRGRTARIEIAFHGRPARGFAGTERMLHTSYFACDWMICAQDTFGDKAAFALELRVATGTDTLSVGRKIARRRGSDRTEIHHWQAPRPYSAYLFGFAVGRFNRVEERAGSARLTFLSDVADREELKRRFAPTAAGRLSLGQGGCQPAGG